MFTDEQCTNFLKDEVAMGKVNSSKKLSEVKAADYDAIFYVGGYGPVIDLPFDADNTKLASDVGAGFNPPIPLRTG